MTKHIPYYSEEELTDLDIKAQDIVETLEHLIRGSQANKAWSAPKAVILPPDGRYIMATLAAMDEPPLAATKSLILNARNVEIGLPQINGLVTLLNGETGVPVAIIDGNWVTAIRTAGLSVTAAKYMANPSASTMGFIGCGVQARSHLKLFADMFPLQHIKIFGRGQKNIDALCRAAEDLGLKSCVCETAQQTVESVDLLVTSVTHTDVTGPFLSAEWLAAGSFATIVDLAVPWHKNSFSTLDRLIIDDLQQEASLPNKLADPADVDGDLSGLVTGKVNGRDHTEDRTAFVFRGHALGDLALSALAYRKFEAINR
ncbi:MAG: ornithine cyclodeaminase family protein [Gammaproteobacteria bacterium]|nr:ornithine cyclodeaminase family protein [Gammaproteobacteria bacterium]MCP5013634.1 ornithine cyclodeaminase family protein [Aestuariibacter sp.]